MRFEVKRSEWFRGSCEVDSALFITRKNRDPNQNKRKRCCLGFFANACGLSDRQISNRQEPHDVSKVSSKKATIDWNNLPLDIVNQIMTVNDSTFRSDKYREKKLIELFKKIGHEIVFVD